MSRNIENFKRGVTELLALMLINENEDLYAYKISTLLKQKSDGMFTVFESSLYLVLIRMEEKGYLTSYETIVKKKLKHRCYNITEAGKERLEQLIKEYDDMAKAVSLIRYGDKKAD